MNYTYIHIWKRLLVSPNWKRCMFFMILSFYHLLGCCLWMLFLKRYFGFNFCFMLINDYFYPSFPVPGFLQYKKIELCYDLTKFLLRPYQFLPIYSNIIIKKIIKNPQTGNERKSRHSHAFRRLLIFICLPHDRRLMSLRRFSAVLQNSAVFLHVFIIM